MAVWLGWFLPETFLRCDRKKAAHLTKIVSGGGHYFIFFPFLTLYPFVSLNWRRFVQAAHTCAAFLRMEFGSRHPLHDPGGCGFSCLQLWLESTLSSGFDFFLPSPSSEESLCLGKEPEKYLTSWDCCNVSLRRFTSQIKTSCS